jgi:hypothetical protein
LKGKERVGMEKKFALMMVGMMAWKKDIPKLMLLLLGRVVRRLDLDGLERFRRNDERCSCH